MRRLLALIILAAAIGGFVWLQSTRPASPAVEARERVWRIATEPVQPLSVRPTLTLYGRIEAPDQVRMAAPLAGRIKSVEVREGERVALGAALLSMDERDLEPRLATVQAEVERELLRFRHDREALEQERALLNLAQGRLARQEKLQAARQGSDSTVDQVREEVARVRLQLTQRSQAIAEHPARLAQAQARLAEVERDVARAQLRAPYPARVARVEVAAGDQVQTGQSMLVLYADEGLFLRAKVPAEHVGELREALATGEVLTATGRFGQAQLRLTLERLGGEADARGVDVLLRLAPDLDVPVGAFLQVELERPAATDVLLLPFAALHGGDRIYQVEDGRLRAHRVERIGERREQGESRLLVRVPDLDPRAEVMVTHLPNAIDGLAVEVVPSPGARTPLADSSAAAG